MLKRTSKEDIKSQLKVLGVQEGDLLFISSDLMRVGYFNETPEKTINDWISIFDDLLGEQGTIVLPSYSPTFLRYFEKYDFVYDEKTISNSGSLVNGYIKYDENAKRGGHPTNSCLAKGKLSNEIIEHSSVQNKKYAVYQKVVELGGKGLMLGTVDEKNAPFTFHYVQEKLNHTTSHPFCGFLETTYLDPTGNKRRFVLREIGGCTAGVHKAWGYHIARGAVRFEQVGRSKSALFDARQSASIIEEIMTTQPHLLVCDNSKCISCKGRYRYVGLSVIIFYISYIPILVRKIMGRAFDS